MGRVYYVPISEVTVAAAQDVFEITAAASKPIKIRRVSVYNTDAETNEQVAVNLAYATGAFTSGSGGASVTPVKTDQLDPTASFSAERNNTTGASGGTITVIEAAGYHFSGGWEWRPTPGEEIRVSPSDAFLVRIPNAPTSHKLSGVVVVEEI